MQTHCRGLFWALLVTTALTAASCSNSASVDAANPVAATSEAAEVSAPLDDQDVDTSGDDNPVADPAPTTAPSRSGGRSPATVERAYESIRDVDFENGFVYDSGLDFGSSVATVSDGVYENGEWGDDEYFGFYVTDVAFGDFDRDGVDDAVVRTSWNGGGTGYFDSVRAFKLVDGVVQEAGIVPFGDRADGGIWALRAADDEIAVWAFSTTLGACCANQVTEYRLVLGEYWLAEADHSVTRRWLALNSTEAEAVSFMPNTSSAVVAIYGFETAGRFTLEAGLGQVLTIDLANGPAPADIWVLDRSTGQIMSGLADMVLPSDAIYEISVTFDGERDTPTTLEVIIDGGEPEPPVRWTPATEQLMIDDDPLVRTSVVWPVFASDQPGVDAANLALAAFVSGLDDSWVEDVTSLSEPLDDSSYEASYEVTAASRDIVAVRFNFFDYVCCRPYPNYGQRAAVLDLTAGRIIPVHEIIDVNRIGEVNAMWFAALDEQGLLPTDSSIVEGEDVVRFDSLTLVPDGIEIGTDRNSLGGGLPGTQVVLTFDQLGDLINPLIVERLQTS